MNRLSPGKVIEHGKSLGFSQALPDEMFHGGRLGGLRAVLRFELAIELLLRCTLQ